MFGPIYTVYNSILIRAVQPRRPASAAQLPLRLFILFIAFCFFFHKRSTLHRANSSIHESIFNLHYVDETG